MKLWAAQVSSNPIDMPYYGIRKYAPKTIESWYCDYMHGGLDALKPGYRRDKGSSRKIDVELAEKILEVIKTYPKAPNTIIYDKLIEKGILKEGQIYLTVVVNKKVTKNVGENGPGFSVPVLKEIPKIIEHFIEFRS